MSVAERLCDRICMVFKGKKVLDGTLDEIQAAYGADTVRVRTADGARAFDGLAGIDVVNDQGNFQELRLSGDPQELLRQLLAKTAVEQFEITRPTLHDIFVRIARPEGSVYQHA
jgi:ABC-2 type transport system ATP-binding protein